MSGTSGLCPPGVKKQVEPECLTCSDSSVNTVQGNNGGGVGSRQTGARSTQSYHNAGIPTEDEKVSWRVLPWELAGLGLAPCPATY